MPRITRAASRRQVKSSVTDSEQPETGHLSPSTTAVAKATDSGPRTTRPALEELNENYSNSDNSLTAAASGLPLVSSGPTPLLSEGASENIENIGKSNYADVDYQRLNGIISGITDDTLKVGFGQQRISSPTMGEYERSSTSQDAQPAQAPSMQLNPPNIHTPRFNPDVHRSPATELAIDDDDSEDSFVKSIITRSPPKSDVSDKRNGGVHCANISRQRTSTKSLSRVQDPLDAIDALEDALEQIGQALPVVDGRGLDSPVRAGTPIEDPMPSKLSTPGARVNNSHPRQLKPKPVAVTSQSVRNHNARLQRSKSTSTLKERNSTRSKGQDTNSSQIRTKPSISSRPTSKITDLGPRQMGLSRKPSQSALSSDAAATPAPKPGTRPRPASIHLSTSKPGFTPSRSTKPTTRPTFELPGEARSKRLKAEREERMKREAEELQRKREFKARELRHNPVPSIPVKETVASRSRGNTKLDNASNYQANIVGPTTQRLRANALGVARTNSLRVASDNRATPKRSLPDLRSTQRSTSMSPSAAISPLNNQLHRSLSFQTSPSSSRRGEQSPTASRANTAALKVRGKDIYERDKLYKEERDRERREKEEAAKRARKEAAERGRLASREWAEKQRLKATMAKRSLNDVRGEKQAHSKQTIT